ncbi:hypothetical protein Tco_0111242 [Tanacetum coccineum]
MHKNPLKHQTLNHPLIAEDHWNKHEEAAASYADLKWSLEEFIHTSFTRYENNDIALRNFQQLLNLFKADHNTILRGILANLKKVQDAVQEDLALNKKVLKATKAYTKNATNLTELLSLVKSFDFSSLKLYVETLKAVVDAQNEHLATWAKSSNYWGGGENFAHTATEEPPSHTKGEKANIDTEETIVKDLVQEPEAKKESASASQLIQITITRPMAPKIDRGKGITTDETEEPTKKLIHASRKVRHDPDALILVPYEINGRMYQLTEEQIQAHLDKEEMLKKSVEEAKLLEMSKPELIKVDAEMKVLSIEHAQKVNKEKEIRQKRIDNYMWTTINRLKPEPIIDVKIHSNTKPALITVYIGTDRRNFEVHNPFEFGNFGLTKLDEPGPIIEKKNNKIVGELMISLSTRYARLNKIPKELGIQSALPAPAFGQGVSQLSRRKRKKMELELEIRIPALECNMSLPEGVPFVNNMVIEEPEYGMFFIDVFGDEAF